MNKQETINVVDFNNMFFCNQMEDNSRDEAAFMAQDITVTKKKRRDIKLGSRILT